MRVLITGGFGYLGGRLAQHLCRDGRYRVRLGSRRSNPLPVWCETAESVQMRWGSVAGLEPVCADMDAIVHLAARNAQDCANDPAAALTDNAVATAQLLQAAINSRVSRFIYLSTAHVYGEPLVGVITEDTCPGAVHPYAASHRAAEDVVRFAHRRNAIEGIVVRLSNAFGAPAAREANCWMLLVNDLCCQAATTRHIVLNSNGMQRRDFIAISDVCAAIELLLGLPAQDFEQPVLNLGGEWAPTVLDMALRIAQRCNAVLRFTPPIDRPERAQEQPSSKLHYCVDRLKTMGYVPRCAIDEEIDATLRLCASGGVDR